MRKKALVWTPKSVSHMSDDLDFGATLGLYTDVALPRLAAEQRLTQYVGVPCVVVLEHGGSATCLVRLPASGWTLSCVSFAQSLDSISLESASVLHIDRLTVVGAERAVVKRLAPPARIIAMGTGAIKERDQSRTRKTLKSGNAYLLRAMQRHRSERLSKVFECLTHDSDADGSDDVGGWSLVTMYQEKERERRVRRAARQRSESSSSSSDESSASSSVAAAAGAAIDSGRGDADAMEVDYSGLRAPDLRRESI